MSSEHHEATTAASDHNNTIQLIVVVIVLVAIIVGVVFVMGTMMRDDTTATTPPDKISSICDKKKRLTAAIGVDDEDALLSHARVLCRRLLCADGRSCCASIAALQHNSEPVLSDMPELLKSDCHQVLHPVYCNGFSMNAASYRGAADDNVSGWFDEFVARAPKLRSLCPPLCVSSMNDIMDCASRVGTTVTDLLKDDPTLAAEMSALTKTIESPLVFADGDDVRLLLKCDDGAAGCTMYTEHVATGNRVAMLGDEGPVKLPANGLTCKLKGLSAKVDETIDLASQCTPPLFGRVRNIAKPQGAIVKEPLPRRLSMRLAEGMNHFWDTCSADCAAPHEH